MLTLHLPTWVVFLLAIIVSVLLHLAVSYLIDILVGSDDENDPYWVGLALFAWSVIITAYWLCGFVIS